MNKIKIIENIQPFNNIFYKNCFYNSLFPIIKHYNKDILPVLVNDVIVYENCDLQFSVDYLSNNNLEEVLNTLAIKMESLVYRENLINDTKKAIVENKPVIIFVDCFYEPFRKDLYKKNHWMHSILIHGYDDNENNMCIVEHSHKDNLDYENRTIRYQDLENSYTGYYHNFDVSADEPSYFEFSLNEQIKSTYSHTFMLDNCSKVFVNNVVKKRDEIINGLKQLRIFSEKFEESIVCEEILENKVDELINSFNIIINSKQCEIYKLSALYGSQNKIVKLQEDIMQNWNMIRIIIAKYKFSKIYKLDMFLSAVDKLKHILKNEYLYIEELKKIMI